jgi:hypothetical protein
VRLVSTVVAALTLAAPAGAGTWTFGRHGGNIRPFTVRIDGSGRVTASGITVGARKLSRATLARLLRTARSGGFFAMPAFTACSGILPDIAGLFVTYRSAASTHTVSVRGGCRPRFTTLYGALSRAAVGS